MEHVKHVRRTPPNKGDLTRVCDARRSWDMGSDLMGTEARGQITRPRLLRVRSMPQQIDGAAPHEASSRNAVDNRAASAPAFSPEAYDDEVRPPELLLWAAVCRRRGS